jgi:hypothetical protein
MKQSRKHLHKQVRAKPPDGPSVWVDEGMKKFLKALWAREIDTFLSCQENQPGVAWVEFAGPYDAIQFLEAAWAVADDDMRDRIEGQWVVPGMWNCNALQEYLGGGEFTLSVGLRLPVEDKDRLADLLTVTEPDEQAEKEFLAQLEQAGSKEKAA